MGAVLSRLRERGMAITAFAALFVLSEVPGDISGHLEGDPNHLLQLVLMACTFPLILGPAVLADENVGGTAAVWRSARLLLRAWPTRLRGYFLVMSPLLVVLGVAAGIREAIELGNPPSSDRIALAWRVLELLAGIPALTVVAAFDTVLYARIEQFRVERLACRSAGSSSSESGIEAQLLGRQRKRPRSMTDPTTRRNMRSWCGFSFR